MSSKTRATKSVAISAAKPRLTVRGISNLSKIQCDPTLQSILTKVGGNVQLKIDQDNSNIGLYKNKTNERFGAISELEKLNGFRKFIADSRKATTTKEIMDPVRELIYRAIKEEGAVEPTRITPGALNVLKEFKIQFGFLEENLEFNEDTYRRLSEDGQKEDFCDLINAWIGSITSIIDETVKLIVVGKDPKGVVAEKLQEAGVPKWAYDKLAKSDLAEAGFLDPEKFLFPRDPRKGVVFTVKEIVDADFAEKNAFLLQNSQFQMKVLANGDLLKAITKTKEDISLTSESDAVGSILRGEKVVISPIRYNSDTLLDDKATKINLIANSSFATPKQALQAVLNAGLAFQTGHFKTNDTIEDFWAKLYPEIDFSSDMNRKKSPLVLIKEKDDQYEPSKKAFKFHSEVKTLFESIIPVMMGLSATSTAIGLVIGLFEQFQIAAPGRLATKAVPAVTDNTGAVLVPAKAATTAIPGWNRPASSNKDWDDIRGNFAIETTEDKQLAKVVWKKAGVDDISLAKRIRANKIAHMSTMTKNGNSLVNQLREHPRLNFLAEPVTDWLCGFSTREIQVVGAEFVRAQFADLTGLEDEEDDPGSSEDESDSFGVEDDL